MPVSKKRKNRKVTHLPAGEGTGKPMAGFKTYGGRNQSSGYIGAGPKGTKTPRFLDQYKETTAKMNPAQLKNFARNVKLAARQGLPQAWPGWRVKAAVHLQYLIDRGLTPSFNA